VGSEGRGGWSFLRPVIRSCVAASRALRGRLVHTSPSRPCEAAPSVCDVLVLTQLVAENTRLRGGTASEISDELEKLWLEFAFVQGEVAA
jgi:hypothetical protein